MAHKSITEYLAQTHSDSGFFDLVTGDDVGHGYHFFEQKKMI